eukprot:TRINITY_DN3696_c0_g3_i3.p1 TRINITY_DN3696_c0_g3~~TRINITY_DN3696_c0_g3_i3.p1  ORF type:complete len:219 (+),score=27.58 TRINITY_DN3696_c0_g3_i3:177-833(+)
MDLLINLRSDMLSKENCIALLKAGFYGLDAATKLWKLNKRESNPTLSKVMSNLNINTIGCIGTGWKVLRFFSNLKRCKILLSFIKLSNIPCNYVMFLGQITGMLYLISTQIYSLDKSKYFSIDNNLALICYSLAAVIYYMETMILQARSYLSGKLSKSGLLYVVLKETLDNFGVIGYLGLVTRTWGFDFANCMGCFLAAVLSLHSCREIRCTHSPPGS